MKHIARTIALLCCLILGASCADNAESPMEREIRAMVKKMTLEEKAGQLVQLSINTITDNRRHALDTSAMREVFGTYRVGSILNVPFDAASDRATTAALMAEVQQWSLRLTGIPTLYGMDMIHGASYISDATFFPQEVNLAATFNPEHAAMMGQVTAYETRAALVPWTFSPVMDLTREAAWPRNWESYGEDPYLQSVMAVAEMRAMQGEDRDHVDDRHIAACIKHYMAYGAPRSGKDRTPAYVSMADLREKYFAPFKACIEAGALSLMVNSASVNGVPVHASKTLLTGWLKEELNWDGMIVTDWADVNNLYEREHVAADRKDAVCIGINAGIDMIMEPYDAKTAVLIKELAEEGRIPMSRLDDAVIRVLRLKYRLGLFDTPVWNVDGYDRFGCEEFRQASYRAAVESEVLLKNEHALLPLASGTRILLTGPNANSMRSLNGGWSYTWQGSGRPEYSAPYHTIYQALQAEFGTDRVTFVPGVVYDEGGQRWQQEVQVDIAPVVAAAASADVIVACIGENSYCETPGNINDLTLSANQRELVRQLAATGKPVVLVLNEGRARIINDIEPLADAIVDIMLPGNYGADALAALLSGRENFSGRLPFTYPRYVNSIHTYDFKVSEMSATMGGEYNYDAVMDVQWPFGTGLSYTTFAYSDLQVDKEVFSAEDTLRFSVQVTNTGTKAGAEAVLLFSSDEVASVIPDVKRLRAFRKVTLQPGASEEVVLTVPARSLAFVGEDGAWHLEEGDFSIGVGSLRRRIRCNRTSTW